MLNSEENRNELIPAFPNLKDDPHFEIEDWKTPNYNCIANAACVFNRWWWPLPEDKRPLQLDGVIYDWPYNAPFNNKLETYMYIFEQKGGYEECADGSYEVGYRKVCFYGNSKDDVKHAARQLVAEPHIGLWISKMGQSFRIIHGAPESLISAPYGNILGFMKCKWP